MLLLRLRHAHSGVVHGAAQQQALGVGMRQLHFYEDGPRIGEFDVDLINEFFQGFVNHALVTLHIDNLRGENAHHQAETVFKAFARALRVAVEVDPRASGSIASTKGSL